MLKDLLTRYYNNTITFLDDPTNEVLAQKQEILHDAVTAYSVAERGSWPLPVPQSECEAVRGVD